MGDRHRVFISYHHCDTDERYRKEFERLFANKFDILDSQAVQLGDIDPKANADYIYQTIRDGYIADATVTVVLVGPKTWQRKFVDWEIYSSLRGTKNNPRNGLLGILLPSYGTNYQKGTVPPRLHDACLGKDPFAKLHWWSTDPDQVQGHIQTAFSRRDREPPPDNSRDLFGKNRTTDTWND